MSNETESSVPPLISMLAEGFSVPLIGLCLLGGILFGLARYEAGKSAPEPKVVRPTPSFSATPSGDDPLEDGDGPAVKGATSERVRAAIDRGQFKEALRMARSLGSDELTDEARLFLALTRSIQPGPFARADALLQVKDSRGKLFVGLLRKEAPTSLRLEVPEGREVDIRKAGLQKRTELRGADAQAALKTHMQAVRKAMGDEVSGLSLHRLAYLAFASDIRQLGARFLKDALVSPEGSILVDMFAEGEFSRLHRARRLLAGETEPDPIAIALLPEREPDPVPTREPVPVRTRDPDPVVTRRPSPTPSRTPQRSDHRYERRPGTDSPDPVMNDSSWLEADAAYRSGLELYRDSFGRGSRATAIAIRASLKEFRRAQDALERVSARYPSSHVVERRQEELAKLVIDCMKRKRVND